MDAGKYPGRAKGLPPSVLLGVGLSQGIHEPSATGATGFKA